MGVVNKFQKMSILFREKLVYTATLTFMFYLRSRSNKKDSGKLTYYPSSELKFTTPNQLPGSITLKYNDSDTRLFH